MDLQVHLLTKLPRDSHICWIFQPGEGWLQGQLELRSADWGHARHCGLAGCLWLHGDQEWRCPHGNISKNVAHLSLQSLLLKSLALLPTAGLLGGSSGFWERFCENIATTIFIILISGSGHGSSEWQPPGDQRGWPGFCGGQSGIHLHTQTRAWQPEPLLCLHSGEGWRFSIKRSIETLILRRMAMGESCTERIPL